MKAAGLKRTTEIQRLAIPELSDGEHVVILAETGSGRGLHAPTFQLNLSALYGIGGCALGLCSPC